MRSSSRTPHGADPRSRRTRHPLTLEILEARTAPSVVPSGLELRVSSYSTGAQAAPTTAIDADGDFVVAWQSNGQDRSGQGVYAQRYSRSGARQGGEFRVNTSTRDHQAHPAAAMNAAGDFLVVWSSFDDPFNFHDIMAQRYNAAGLPLGTEFRISTATWV